MKRIIAALCLAAVCAAAPAAAQTPEPDVEALLRAYIDAFNKGDAERLARDVYRIPGEESAAKQARLAEKFAALRQDSFGRIDLFGMKACPASADATKAELRLAWLYTFGGYMEPGEQALVFDLAKTADGWRVTGETSAPLDSQFSCPG
jgi:hypothetical protein